MEPKYEVEKLTIALHELIRKGEGDGEAADDIREEIDLHWGNLQPDEKKLLAELSGVLGDITSGINSKLKINHVCPGPL